MHASPDQTDPDPLSHSRQRARPTTSRVIGRASGNSGAEPRMAGRAGTGAPDANRLSFDGPRRAALTTDSFVHFYLVFEILRNYSRFL